MQKMAIAILALGVTGAYLGLAIWGEGGFTAFFSHPSLVALTVLTFAMAATATLTEGSVSSGVREDYSNRWVLIAFGLIGIIDGLLPAWSDRAGFWVIGGGLFRWLGVAVFAIGGALRLWPMFVLGRRFSGLVAIQPGHELVTDGIYGLVRNPSYIGLILVTLGWGLAFRSWAGVLLTLLLFPPLIARMDSEERLLASQFGDAYEAYRGGTWRLIPWVY